MRRANEIVNAVESQGDKLKTNSSVTTNLLQDLEQLASWVEAVAAIARENSTSTSDLVKLLHERKGPAPASDNGNLRELASQLKQAAVV